MKKDDLKTFKLILLFGLMLFFILFVCFTITENTYFGILLIIQIIILLCYSIFELIFLTSELVSDQNKILLNIFDVVEKSKEKPKRRRNN